MLHAASLSKEFWSLAVKHLAWIKNRVWHRALQIPGGPGASPFQVLYGRPPRLSMARTWGCDAWRLDHSHRSGSFEPKGKKGIFVGMSANRKGWVIFDPKTRTVRTTFHCSFDESLEGRRCALRDFELRQHKAGPGATADEERLARLEGQLYDKSVDLPFEDDLDMVPHGAATHRQRAEQGSPRVQHQKSRTDSNTCESTGDPIGSKICESDHRAQDGRPNGKTSQDFGARAQQEAYDQHAQRQLEKQDNGGRNQGEHDVPHIPYRRAAIGQEQELSEEDANFLRFAFEHDMPCVLQQRNPKRAGSDSRVRYEKYKGAHTLRDVKRRGGTWADIVWDYARGYIDFNISGFASMEDFIQQRLYQRGIGLSPAAGVDESLNLSINGQFGALSLQESVQQDYAWMAMEHIETLSHRTQRILQKALGKQTLVQFAHCCASRIIIPEPLTVVEAMATALRSQCACLIFALCFGESITRLD